MAQIRRMSLWCPLLRACRWGWEGEGPKGDRAAARRRRTPRPMRPPAHPEASPYWGMSRRVTGAGVQGDGGWKSSSRPENMWKGQGTEVLSDCQTMPSFCPCLCAAVHATLGRPAYIYCSQPPPAIPPGPKKPNPLLQPRARGSPGASAYFPLAPAEGSPS